MLSTEDEYGQAFKKVLESLGAKVDTNYPQVGGIGVRQNWPYLLKNIILKHQKPLRS